MKRAPRSRQRHDLYAKYHDYDSEISDLLGECGFRTRDGIFEYLKAQCARLPCDVFRVGGYSLRHKDLDGYASRQKEDDFEKCLQIFLHIIDDENEFYYVRREIFELQTQRNQIYVDNGRAFKCERVGDLAVWRGAFSKIDLLQKFEK